MTGKPVELVAAGGVNDGRSLAAALMLGAGAVWVGTRFVTAIESGASQYAKDSIIKAGFDSAIKSVVWSGRPLRAQSNPYIEDWEKNRQAEIKDLTSRGLVPLQYELDRLHREGKLTEQIEDDTMLRPMGVVAGLVNKPGQSAGEIVKEIVEEATELLSSANEFVVGKAKL